MVVQEIVAIYSARNRPDGSVQESNSPLGVTTSACNPCLADAYYMYTALPCDLKTQ